MEKRDLGGWLSEAPGVRSGRIELPCAVIWWLVVGLGGCVLEMVLKHAGGSVTRWVSSGKR